MLIVLEGCDGAGKTTLAQYLAKIHNAEIIHCTRETPNDAHFFSTIVEASKHKNIIADRFCYGQFVYQTPEERSLSDRQLINLELLMLEADVKTIYVTASPMEIRTRLAARGEILSLDLDKILRGYDKVWERSLSQPIVWNTGKGLSL